MSEKYFKTSKQRTAQMKAAFAARVNLVTRVVEVANVSCWLRMSGIETEAYEKIIVSLQCFERNQSAFK